MPANTSPDNIQFPVAGDQIAPLNTVFQNLAQTTQTALTRRVVANVADFTALVALSTTGKLAGDLAFVVEGAVYMSWTGTIWRQVTTATFATAAARDTAYAKASAAFRVVRVRAIENVQGIESQWNGSAWSLLVPLMAAGTAVSPATATSNVTFPAGRFSVAPIVVATMNSFVVNAQILVNGITATGCQVLVYNISTGSEIAGVTLRWQAVQMLSGSAAG